MATPLVHSCDWFYHNLFSLQLKESNMYKFTSEQLAKLEEKLKGKR